VVHSLFSVVLPPAKFLEIYIHYYTRKPCRNFLHKHFVAKLAKLAKTFSQNKQDGLSGSVSAASGEVGLLGGTFGQGTVVKGQDKPPSVSIPGLDFGSKEGRQLLGYN
jgi:hypothetical protein